MLAGVCLQPVRLGAHAGPAGQYPHFRPGDQNVTTPFHIVLRAGNIAGRIEIERVTATGAYRIGLVRSKSRGNASFTNVVFRNVSMEFTGGGAAEEARREIRPPDVDAGSCPPGASMRAASSICGWRM